MIIFFLHRTLTQQKNIDNDSELGFYTTSKGNLNFYLKKRSTCTPENLYVEANVDHQFDFLKCINVCSK